MKFSLSFFLSQQFSRTATVEDFRTDLSGKAVIITGGSSGLGLECARHLARMMGKGTGAGRLIIACRNVEKGRTALQSIRETTEYDGGEVWLLDLAKFHTISAFADRFEKEGPGHLDFLIENAGLSTRKYNKTEDGWESTLQANFLGPALLAFLMTLRWLTSDECSLQANFLGPALLAFLMLPYLNKASVAPPSPRITFVASNLHYIARISDEEQSAPVLLKKLSDEAYCNQSIMNSRYNVSKLLDLFFSRAFASRIPRTSPLVVNALEPGFCKSSLAREAKESLLGTVVMNIMFALLARTAEEGGRAIAHGALTVNMAEKRDVDKLTASQQMKDPKALHGKYLANTKLVEESDFVISAEGKVVEDRLWDETVEILGSVDERVKKIIGEFLQ